MAAQTYESVARSLLEQAGIEVKGKNPWDFQVHNPETYRRVLTEGSLGLGESYMDGWWDCEALDQFIYRVLMANLETKVKVTFTHRGPGAVLPLRQPPDPLTGIEGRRVSLRPGERPVLRHPG